MRVLMLLLFMFVSPVLAQERSFTVTLTESQWNSIAKKIGKGEWEEFNPAIQSISVQIQQQIQQEAKRAVDALAEVDRLKAELAKRPAAPAPEQQP